MSTEEKICLTGLQSTVFCNVWQLQECSGSQWKSNVYFGQSLLGWQMSWHYILDLKNDDQFYDEMSGRCSPIFNAFLSVFVDHCSASMDAQVEVDDEPSKINGKTKTGSILGTISIPGNPLVNSLECEETVTFHFKFSVIEDRVLQDSQLQENYLSLLTNKDLSDVTIEVGPETFYAQKAILSVRSPVFAAMFQSGLQESQQNRVVVEDTPPEVFKELLRFIYVGNVLRLDDMAHELLAAADKYALDRLRTICGNHLLACIEKETVLNTLALADVHHAENLKKQAIKFICENIKSFKNTEWMSLNQTRPDLVVEILGDMPNH